MVNFGLNEDDAGAISSGCRRLEPTPDMPDDVAEIFRRVVKGMKAGFYGEVDYNLLSSYCYAQATANHMQAEVCKLRDYSLQRPTGAMYTHPLVLAMQKQAALAASIACKLRISPSTRTARQEDPSAHGTRAKDESVASSAAEGRLDPARWQDRVAT